MSEPSRKDKVPAPYAAERLYALLYQLSADVKRLDTLVRNLKKTIEERQT